METAHRDQQPPGVWVQEAARIIDTFKEKKICIVGDIIADIFIFGKPYRLSREAPVVVIEYEEERLFPGSAGNTVNNLLSLGAHVCPMGFIARDAPGDKLIEYFASHGKIDMDGLIRFDGVTITKTRIMAGDTHTSKQQVIRIDKDKKRLFTAAERQLLLERLEAVSPHMDAFILSDYGHGVVDDGVISFMRRLAGDKIVVGDSRYNLRAFKDLTLISPNEAEAYELSGLPPSCDIGDVGRAILEGTRVRALLITRGNRGMSLFLESGERYDIPISGTDDVTDVTGAGDTVCATVTLSLAGGADLYTASRIANHAAGVVVMKRGTATVTTEELRRAIKSYGTIRRKR